MISVVVPVFNEAETLGALHQRVTEVMQAINMPFEIIFVDDGSTDNSLEIALALRREDKNAKVLELSRNFGHQMAIAAGLDYACGEAVITMDGDLQHPPELIPALVEKWQEGYDVVLTLRQGTADTGLLKDVSSRLFYGILSSLSQVRIPAGAADFRLLDRKVVEVFRALGERALFHRGLVSWIGHRQAAISYEAHARHSGKSKYSLSRMLRFAVSGVTSFSSLPLYIAAFAGVVISALSFAYAAFAVYARLFTDRVVEGWTSVLVAVLFLGGMQLIALGTHGAYLARIYDEVKGRPRYLVRQSYGFDE